VFAGVEGKAEYRKKTESKEKACQKMKMTHEDMIDYIEALEATNDQLVIALKQCVEVLANQLNQRSGLVSLKLFNLIIKDLGEELLRKGIIVSLSDIADLLKTRSGDLSEALTVVRVDGRGVDPTRTVRKEMV
jgi:hypothetical protein